MANLLGDADRDREITSGNVLTILRSSVDAPEQTKIADVDNDGEITTNDALAVLRYSVDMRDDSNISGSVYASM